MTDPVQEVLHELDAGEPGNQLRDNDIYTRLVEIKFARAAIGDEEKKLRHESAMLTKDLEKRFAESDTHSIKKKIGKTTWNFSMSRHLQVKDLEPERTAQWFEENGYPGLASINNRRLSSMLQDLLQDETLGEWINEPDRLPEGLRDLVKIGERTALSLRAT